MFFPTIAFSAPLILTALAILPLIYYLLRLTPPRPREIPFPPLKLILDAPPKEETPARTPWWVMLLRLALAALVIFAMAGPVLNPIASGGGGRGPLVLLMDDGWPAANDWALRVEAAAQRLEAAGREGRPAAILAFSEGPRQLTMADASKTIERLRALKPQPLTPDRMLALPPLQAFLAGHAGSDIVWIADGLALGASDPFAQALAHLQAITVLAAESSPLALNEAQNQPGALEVNVLRAGAGPGDGVVRGLDLKGLPVGTAHFDFAGSDSTKARFDLPIELRNDIARLDIVGQNSAGAVALMDERWKRRRVGIVSGESNDVAQPLLAPNYYLNKALAPFAEVREAQGAEPIQQLIDAKAAVIFLADVGVVSGPAHQKLVDYIENGGVLVRFAGVRLAGSSDDLVPVRLRRGGRVLGGSLSWDRPKQLATFERESPFFGLTVPAEVTVTRQVLAEPEAGLRAKTWAALADGTPLVTAVRRGKGLIALVHVSADTTWSNLPISGLFVDILRRFVAMGAQGAPAEDDKTDKTQEALIAPTRTLDGFGVFTEPPPSAKPIPVNFAGTASSDHPPGLYGPVDALVAINTVPAGAVLARANLALTNFAREPLKAAEPVDLRPWLIVAVLALFLTDALVSLWLSGAASLLSRWRPARAAALLALLLALPTFAPPPVKAETLSSRDMGAVLQTRLAYAITGDRKVDEASRAGLGALSAALEARTSLAPGEPVGVDPARDELAFYPLIYWPVVADQPQPTAQAVAKLTSFMKQGGTILFDTRDALTARPDGPPTPEARWLRNLLAGVDVPELERVPADHVVTKTFYLLQGFVGRYTIGETWIEALPPPDPADPVARPARAGDSVSPIILTSNDLASAWAVDGNGEPLYPLVPGGARQRELALRGGINLVMYTLTGNYKADQVHVRDLLERLAH